MTNITGQPYLLCSDCFNDEGLRLDSVRIGERDESACPNCGSKSGAKLTEDLVSALAHRFFVWGTIQRGQYGAAPIVQFNKMQSTNIAISPWLVADVKLLERAIG